MENNSYTYNSICTEDLTRYYLPIIPGYPIEIILIFSGTVVGILILILKKKRIN